MWRIEWTVAFVSGPAVGSAVAASRAACATELAVALRRAAPGWSEAHAQALGELRRQVEVMPAGATVRAAGVVITLVEHPNPV